MENNRQNSQINHPSSGFTLLETIIAMAIMTVAFAAILMVESGSIKASERTKQMNIVAMLARDAMTDAERKFQGKSFEEVKKEDAGNFDAPYQEYSWNSTIKEVEFPSLNMAAPSQGGGSSSSSSGSGSSPSNSSASNSSSSSAPPGGGNDQSSGDMAQMVTKVITNYLSKAIREVTVTVSWKKGTNLQSFSVTSYWVDLNHEFSLTN